MGDYTLGWYCLYNFSKTPRLTHLSDAIFNADHDKIIKIYIFSKDGGPACIFGPIITYVAKNFKGENDNNFGPKRCYMMRGIRICYQNSN